MSSKGKRLHELEQVAAAMVQGSLSESTRQCGDPACACAHDPTHRHGPHLYFRYKSEGKVHSVYVPAELGESIRHAQNAWAEFQQIGAEMSAENRERLLAGDVAARFMSAVLHQPRVKALLSDEHFSGKPAPAKAGGTLIEAWASIKSFRPKDGSGAPPGPGRNGERDFHGEKRRNETHASTTDPEARLYRKGSGQPAKLAYLGHVLMENRSALAVDARLTLASGTAEREAALDMLNRRPGRRRLTVAADKAYDAAEFVAAARDCTVTPHVAQNTSSRRSAIDRRTTRHHGYDASQRLRKRIEEIFGWVKTTAGLRKTRHRGLARVGWMFTLATTAYNLVRLPKLLEAAA